MYSGSYFTTSSPTLVVDDIFDDGYSKMGVVLIGISFISRDGEHFFIWFLAI
jgi:hypothetical protein